MEIIFLSCFFNFLLAPLIIKKGREAIEKVLRKNQEFLYRFGRKASRSYVKTKIRAW